jgi:hypothetical protein
LSYDTNLAKEFNGFNPALQVKIKEILDNSGKLVTSLYAYDNELFDIDTTLLKERFSSSIKGTPTTNALLIKELAYNSILRSGISTASSMLALYDDSDYLSVDSVIFKIELLR